MIKEFESSRIPPDYEIDEEHEYLTYCESCRKDILVPKEYPAGKYYCSGCRAKFLSEKKEEFEKHFVSEKLIQSRFSSSIKKSSKAFSTSITFFLFAFAFLIFAVGVELSKENSFRKVAWGAMALSILIAIFYSLRGFLLKRSERKKASKPKS
ncbi:MAG: hypothetical protein K9G57_02770 [Ignavibacteriales bacterium]|nr:hypothetical protein [Ignavibacteriales bacterium]MCF8435741.1 hypothetical protein [Ignavibacteriales bacterium]